MDARYTGVSHEQKIEFMFSASPETNRREPRELAPSLSPVTCGTWQPAHRMILIFFLPGEVFTQRQCR